MKKISVIEEKIPVNSLLGSLLSPYVFRASNTTAKLAQSFTCDTLCCTPYDVPHPECDTAGRLNLDLIGAILVVLARDLVLRVGKQREPDMWENMVREARRERDILRRREVDSSAKVRWKVERNGCGTRRVDGQKEGRARGLTANRRLDFSTAMNVHAHLMSRGLAAGTVVRKNEGEIDGSVVCIRCKVPLLLWSVMNLVSASAKASEMFWRILGGRK